MSFGTARLSALVLAAATAAGCPRRAPEPIHNAEAADAAELPVAADQPLGWIALAPAARASDAVPAWVPISTAASALIEIDGESPPAQVVAYPAAGGSPATLTAGAVARVPYGCDQNALEAVPLTGAPLAPGVAWVPPTPLPPGWQPTAIPVHADRVTASAAAWTIGDVGVVIARDGRAPTHALLSVTVDGHEIRRHDLEKAMMDGADDGPIDLTGANPGIPVPVAAFAVAPSGPAFVVWLYQGYEGVTLVGELVGRTATREGPSVYLYSCAF